MKRLDLRTIFASLAVHRVEYVLVGALGAVAHGARLLTQDVDLCISTNADNLERIAAVLRALDATLLREPPTRPICSVDLNDWMSLRLDDPSEHHLFHTPYGDIDVLPEPLGPTGWGSSTRYELLQPGAVFMNVFDVIVPVAAFEDIMASKLGANRSQDRAAVAELQHVQARIERGNTADYGLEQFACDLNMSAS